MNVESGRKMQKIKCSVERKDAKNAVFIGENDIFYLGKRWSKLAILNLSATHQIGLLSSNEG